MDDRQVFSFAGWVQVNNTVVPQLKSPFEDRELQRYVPLPVIQYGAGLLRERKDNSLHIVKAMQAEIAALTMMCQKAGITFTFDQDVGLVTLEEVIDKCEQRVVVTKLPDDNKPLGNSQFIPGLVKRRMVTHVSNTETEPEPVSTLTYGNDTMGNYQLTTCSNKTHEKAIPEAKKNCSEPALKPTQSKAKPPPPCRSSMKIDSWRPWAAQSSVSAAKSQERHSESMQDNPLDLSSSSTYSSHSKPREESRKQLKLPRCVIQKNLNSTENINDKNTIIIHPVKLQGRVVPCLSKGDKDLLLVETLRRAFFPRCSLRGFLYLVQRSVPTKVYTLSDEDIQAIFKVVRNPTSINRCPEVVDLSEAVVMLPSIKDFLLRVEHHRQVRNARQQTGYQSSSDDFIKSGSASHSHGDFNAEHGCGVNKYGSVQTTSSSVGPVFTMNTFSSHISAFYPKEDCDAMETGEIMKETNSDIAKPTMELL